MRGLILFVSFLMIAFFSGCEREQTVDPGLDYRELLVVQSEIRANAPFPGVRITRTLPVGVPYSLEKAEIKDAIAYLIINGIRTIPLHYAYDGIYKPLYEFTVSEGDVYELFGGRGDQTFYSRTIIPSVPLIQSAAFNAAGYSEAILSARKDEVYGAVWIVNVPNAKSETDFFAIVSGSAGTLVSARTSAMPVEYRGADHRFARAIRVFAFDPAFEKYFKTRGAIRDIDNPYIQTSGKTEWNVTGNNVIGLFLGIAETMRSTH